MSASDEEVSAFLHDGSELAAKVSGGVTGALVGGLIAGPPGAAIGAALAPFLEHQFKRLAGEFLHRQLGQRQRNRAGAGAILLTAAVQRHLDEGLTLRADDFDKADETGRRPMDELAEHAIISMISAVDERRLPYLANLYAGLYFDERINRSSIPTLVSVADGLNYRAFCLLKIVGDGRAYTGRNRVETASAEWPPIDHIVAKELFGLTTASILVAKATNTAHYDTILSYMDMEPQLLQLSPMGQLLSDKMLLSELPEDDPTLLETEASVRRITLAPSGTALPDLSGIVIDGGTF